MLILKVNKKIKHTTNIKIEQEYKKNITVKLHPPTLS